MAYAMLPALVWLGLPPLMAVSIWLGAPLGAWQGRRVLWGAWADPARWDSVGFCAVALLVGTTVAELVALLLPAVWA